MKWPLSDWFSNPRREPPPAPRRRLRLEVLEDRAVPAVLHVTNLTDPTAPTPGTLRYDIANSNAGDTIVLDVAGTLQLNAAKGALVPTHSLTVRGLGPNLDAIRAGGANRIITQNSTGIPLTFSGLTLTGGHAYYGGAIDSFGPLTIDNCTITGNTAVNGGGIFVIGGLTITNSTVSGNTAPVGEGGGIFAEETVKIVNSTISGNSAKSNGGGLNVRLSDMTITGSTISGNTSGGDGGGVFETYLIGTSTIANSTITGNTSLYGGGLFVNSNGTLHLVNDTVVGNAAHGGGGGLFLRDRDFYSPLHTNVVNTIVANNTDTTNQAPDIRTDRLVMFHGIEGSISSYHDTTVNAYHSLIGSTAGATFAGSTATDLFGVDPHLGPLQNNGGTTMTMALLAGSVAIDAGDDSVLGPPAGLSTDQRGPGFARKVGVHVDIGAFEYAPPPPPPPPRRHGRIF